MAETLIQPTDRQTRLINEIGEGLGTGTINSFGRQFAGKDTNLDPIAEQFGTKVISSGDVLRKQEVSADVAADRDSGALVDSDAFEAVVTPHLSHPKHIGMPLVLSAVGRKLGEEKTVIAVTEAAGHPTRAVVQFDITREESFRRLEITPARGRSDDTVAGLTRRLDAYEEDTIPVLKTYEDMGLLIVADAMPALDVVFNSFVHQLHDRMTGKG